MIINRIGLQTPEQSIAEKTGALWDCFSRTPYPHGGYIYSFELNTKFDDRNPLDLQKRTAVRDMLDSIYPATEWDAHEACCELPGSWEKSFHAFDETMVKILNFFGLSTEQFGPKSWSYFRILHYLGYQFRFENEKMIVDLPDHEALQTGWKELQKVRPELPPFNILSSDGIADHVAFAEAYVRYDVLLSTGKEFFHDHAYHVKRVIALMLEDSDKYKREKERLARIVATVLRPIKIAKTALAETKLKLLKKGESTPLRKSLCKIEATLGAAVDAIASYTDYCLINKISEQSFLNIVLTQGEHPYYQKYWKRQFTEADMSATELTKVWNQVKTIERRYEAKGSRRTRSKAGHKAGQA
jgi:hypothetical protein